MQNREKLSADSDFKLQIIQRRNRAIDFRREIDASVLSAITHYTEYSTMGFVIIKDKFKELSEKIQFFTLRHIFLWINAGHHAPRTEKIEHAMGCVNNFDSFTVGGCQGKFLQGKYYIFRELSHLPDPVKVTMVYDERYVTDCTDNAYTIGSLGRGAGTALKALGLDVKEVGIPKTVLATIPALYCGGVLCKIVGLSFKNQSEYGIFHQNKYLMIYSPF